MGVQTLLVLETDRALIKVSLESNLRACAGLGGLSSLLDTGIMEMSETLMPYDVLLFSCEVTDGICFRFFHDVIPCDLGCGC